MRVLVSGIDGFTGQYLQTALESHGHKVLGLTTDLRNPDDIATEIEAVKPEAMIHLAAVTFVGHEDSNEFYEVNLIGTRNLLVALAQYAPDIRGVLIASSANIYGNSSSEILSEDTSASPVNDYAVSKYAMELMARLWMKQLPVFITRPFNYTGVGQSDIFVVPKIVSHFKTRKNVIHLGNLDVWRELNDVRFVAETYASLIGKAPTLTGQIINVCTGVAYSLSEVISLCEEITGHKIEVKVNPDLVRKNEVKVLKGNNNLLKQILGEVEQYSLEQTLRSMLAQ